MKYFATVESTDSTTDLQFDVEEGATVGDIAAVVAERAGVAVEPGSVSVATARAPDVAPSTPVANSRLRSGDRLRLVASQQQRALASGPASLYVMGTAGDAVAIHTIHPGDNVIGRGGGAAIVIDDASISRNHVRIVLNNDGTASLTDLKSTNGTMVDGVPVTRSVALAQTCQIRVGNVEVQYRQAPIGAANAQLAAPARGSSGPVVYFNRPPRTEPRYPGKKFKAPTPPTKPDPEPFNWAPALVPIMMAGALYAITKQVASIMFALLSPAMISASWWQQRVNARKNYEKKLAEFRSDVKMLEHDVATEQDTEALARRGQAPESDELMRRAVGRGPELWIRGVEDSDFLLVRVGRGDQPSVVSIEVPEGGDRGERAAIDNLPTRFGIVPDVPVEADLRAGGIGFAGPTHTMRAATRSLLAQLAALHSPAELVVAALLSEEEAGEWEWLKWLPHTRFPLSPIEGQHLAATPAACADLLRRLGGALSKRGDSKDGTPPPPSTWVVLLIDERARVDRPTLDALLRVGPSIGLTFVWVANHPRDLPRLCHSVVTLDSSNPILTFAMSGAGKGQHGIRADGVEHDIAERFARGLAAVQDISARMASELDLPAVVLLSELLGGASVLWDVAGVHQRWTTNGAEARTLKSPVGQAPGEEFSIDIVQQGPHGFLIGTTGSGKSEFLRTLLISLAASYGPERVNFLLLDFKGGAALKPFLDLPHTIGLVTNLAEGESNAEAKLERKVRRTIVWLRAELQRRMSLLNDAGYSDISDMEKVRHDSTPPRLVIVADEFAVLAKNDSSDDVIDEIVNIARLGRSLGIHLLLATQRAAGVITDNIRANTNLKIALRVQDLAESQDVVGSPDAARISLALPGRAFVSVGAGNLTQVQTASSTGHTTALQSLPKVSAEPFTFIGRTPTAAVQRKLPAGTGPNDLTLLTATVAEAARLWPVVQPESHWVEPPPDLVSLHSLNFSDDPFVVTFGTLDDPENQTSRPAEFDFRRSGSLLVFGTGRSGKTVLLRTIAMSLADRLRPQDLCIFGLDCSGRGLEPIAALPAVANVITADDTEMVFRLFVELRRIVDRRLLLFASLGVADLAEYRALRAEGEDRHLVVVLLDGIGPFVERYDVLDGGVLVERLGGLLLDGRAAGVHFVMSAHRRGGIPMAVASAVSEQVILRMANPDEYGMLDVRAARIPLEPAAGAGLYGRHSMQSALVTTPEVASAAALALASHDEAALAEVLLVAQSGEEQARAIEARAEVHRNVVGSVSPWTLQRLPDAVELDALLGLKPVDPPWTCVVGITESLSGRAVLRLDEAHAIVTGPPRSGKSTALATIAGSLRRSTPGLTTLLIGTRRSPASDAGQGVWDSIVLNDDDAVVSLSTLGDAVRGGGVGPTLVCFDDYTDLDDVTVGAAFAALFNEVKRGAPVRFVLAAEPRALMNVWNDAAKAVRRFRTGLLLAPDIDADGDLVGTRLPRQFWRQFPPGRGFLVQGPRVELAQVAAIAVAVTPEGEEAVRGGGASLGDTSP